MPLNGQDLKQSDNVNGLIIRQKYWKSIGLMCRGGEISGLLQEIVFMRELEERQLTLFQADSPASRSVLPGSSEAMKMTVSSGLKCLELYKNYSPVGCLARMLLESSIWRSTKCFLTWKISDMRLKHLLFQLAASMPHTGGTEYLLWGTPNTMDSLPSRSYEAMKRQATNGGRKNRKRPSNLREQVDPLMCQAYKDAQAEANRPKMWPTPNASDRHGANMKNNHDVNRGYLRGVVKMLPTPRASDSKGSGPVGSKSQQYMEDKSYLCATVATEQSGQLNPDWVEWLMGFPVGHTNLTESHESQQESKTEQTDLNA